MSISGIAGQPPVFQTNPQQNALRQNFQSLVQALQSGDLQGAQTAYATLTQNMPSDGQNATGNRKDPFQQMIAQLGQQLQSGDLSGAQSTLQNFQAQMKAHHGHHHHGGGVNQANAGIGSSSTNAASSSADNDGDSDGSSVNFFA